MSVRNKDLRLANSEEIHEMLRQMSEFHNKPMQSLEEEIFAEAVAGRFHSFRVMLARMERSGILRTAPENRGSTRKGSEGS